MLELLGLLEEFWNAFFILRHVPSFEVTLSGMNGALGTCNVVHFSP